LALATLPSESVARTTSVTLPVEPAAYAPVEALMEPPEAFVAIAQEKPEPEPPLAEKATLPPGEADALAGEMETPAVTETLRVVVLESESVTLTTSVTLPVAPAVYAPVEALTVPPEALVTRAQVYPLPDPPEAVRVV
jgi:hypothetical protein